MLVAYGGLVVSVSATFSAGSDLGSRVSVTLVKEETGVEGGGGRDVYIYRERDRKEKDREMVGDTNERDAAMVRWRVPLLAYRCWYTLHKFY